MQCQSCHFENIPGMQRCVRCQSALTFDDVIAVPPRASGMKWKTRWQKSRNRFRAILKGIPSFMPRWPQIGRRPTNWEAIVRSVVPGLGHLYIDRRYQGCMILTLWVALLTASLVLMGLPSASFCLNGAIAIHAAAILSLLGREMADIGFARRMLVGITVFSLLWFALYMPVGWAAQSFWTPFTVMGITASDTIRDGDTVLYQGAWFRPNAYERGDLALYHIRTDNATGVAHIRLDGFGLDRVLGVPGDQIEFTQDQILINGQPVDPHRGPLRAIASANQGTQTLSPGEYFIYPSVLRLEMHGVVAADKLLQQLSHVPQDRIIGRIVFRVRPWSRFGSIE